MITRSRRHAVVGLRRDVTIFVTQNAILRMKSHRQNLLDLLALMREIYQAIIYGLDLAQGKFRAIGVHGIFEDAPLLEIFANHLLKTRDFRAIRVGIAFFFANRVLHVLLEVVVVWQNGVLLQEDAELDASRNQTDAS